MATVLVSIKYFIARVSNYYRKENPKAWFEKSEVEMEITGSCALKKNIVINKIKIFKEKTIIVFFGQGNTY